ncbi:tRNA (cytidine(34)-2'-O)-methyltransferase [Anaerorhabdus sp.]|uniref:tRNA (cytidine(34)-2'-O)-methyltransferase n=1 Tax=Anaerorhabdus sp. TaxID=1872524 RepID=UPI002FCC3FD3
MIHVVLFEPEIPQNTGNIMRTCMASNCKLHLIEPLGFSLDEKHLRRSGMDYRDKLDVTTYSNWDEFCSKNEGTYFYITRYGRKSPTQFDYKEVEGDIYLVFGKESTGIPKDILKDHLGFCARLPMVADARSLNLSNCVAICVYEVLRQLDYPGLSPVEVIKGEDWLEHD